MAKFDAFEQFRMHDHVAIVTGGAQNIGEGIARTFSGAGAKVMIADLNSDKAVATAKAIAEETGNDVRGIGCNVTVEADAGRVRIRAEVETTARTGVEMEALTAASIAALNVYDLVKGIDPDLVIEGVRLLEKTKGAPTEGA